MIGITETDIQLSNDGQPLITTSGDYLTISDLECFLQDIKNEAITQEGEIFYDDSYGWGLLDFMQQEDDELLDLEIQQRIKEKLINRKIVEEQSISINLSLTDDIKLISVKFNFIDSDAEYNIDLTMDKMNIEVISDD